MIITAALIPAALLAVAQVAPEPTSPPLVVPTDWTAMPPLPWRAEPAVTPGLIAFVAGEVRAGRCAARAGNATLVRVAVFVRADGLVRAAVPRAIDCPTVEQFAAGLVTSFARNNLRTPAAGWYQVTVTFDWGK
jgi:hypothetical protein